MQAKTGLTKEGSGPYYSFREWRFIYLSFYVIIIWLVGTRNTFLQIGVANDWVIKDLGRSSRVCATGYIKEPLPLVVKCRALCFTNKQIIFREFLIAFFYMHQTMDYCEIESGCYAQEVENPSNDCEYCNPSVSQKAWAYLEGTS